MAFKKGISGNVKGRAKGSPNKITQLQRDYVQTLLNGQQAKIKLELSKLKGKEYLVAVTSLMEYVMPKLQRTELKTETEIFSSVPVFLNVPPGYQFGMLPSNTDGDDEPGN